jgi:hypothetical protein
MSSRISLLRVETHGLLMQWDSMHCWKGKIMRSIQGSGKGVLQACHCDKEVILIFWQGFILNWQQLESRGLTACFIGIWNA